MATMRLWDDHIESLREEARTLLPFLEGVGPEPPGAQIPTEPQQRAEAMRAAMAAMRTTEPSPSGTNQTIPGPAGDLPVRVFRPEGDARAVFLHLHGGGWVLGDAEMSDLANEHLASAHGLAVVSVDYRLAPEHPYPAGPDDCEAAAAWLLEHGADEFGADALFIGGESAGGHLALVTALRVRDRLDAIERVLGLNLVFGWYDVNGTPSQADNGGQIDMLTPGSLRFMVDAFTPGLSAEQRRDPDISPLFANLSDLPPALISVGSGDHLCDDSLFLATLLAKAERDVELAVYPDSPHGFMALPTEMAKAHAARVDTWITRVLTDAGR